MDWVNSEVAAGAESDELVQYIVQHWGRTPTTLIAWELSMILSTSGQVSYQGDFILAHIELSCPDSVPLREGHPSGGLEVPDMTMMTMFDQMTSINVAHQDEDLESFIKCVNWDKNSIVNIWEEQKQSLWSLNLYSSSERGNWVSSDCSDYSINFPDQARPLIE